MKRYFAPVFIVVVLLVAGMMVVNIQAESVENHEINRRSERGPGVYCEVCDGEPQQLEQREEFRRERMEERAEGDRGEKNFRQQRNQKMRQGQQL